MQLVIKFKDRKLTDEEKRLAQQQNYEKTLISVKKSIF
jgi:hypothetical protein